jgi:hypothetical protein
MTGGDKALVMAIEKENRKMAFGRPSTYGLGDMAVGDAKEFAVSTAADVNRVARNVSQYGIRNNRYYRCKTNRKARITTVTRIR